jgi:putative sugar O-methyltransferase
MQETSLQAADDPDLLDEMVADQRAADPVFQTTRYWARYEHEYLPYLKRNGLRDFRSGMSSDGGATFFAFGATDAFPENRRARSLLGRFLGRPGPPPDLSVAAEAARAPARAAAYAHAEAYGRDRSAAPLSALSASLVGNPVNRWQVDGRWLTRLTLYYYMRYAYVSGHVSWTGSETIVELGSGSGIQCEVLAKLHPGMTLLLFDIPPQLYVAHQYLSAVFGDRVVPYREAKGITEPSKVQKGRIHILPNWRFDLVRDLAADLFWSAATFGEMEPNVVLNYLSQARVSTQSAYLMQVMKGRSRGWVPWRHGVRRPTVFAHYVQGLDGFSCIDRKPALLPGGKLMPGYDDSFWTRV